MRIYRNRVLINNIIQLPDEIIAHIIEYLKPKERIKCMMINKYMYQYPNYLDIKDYIAIACYRNNIQVIKHYYKYESTQKYIFDNIIRYDNIYILDQIKIDNLSSHIYANIIQYICKYNSKYMFLQFKPYIQSINYDPIYAKNVFENKYYLLFKLLYKFTTVRYTNMDMILIDACRMNIIDIVKLMLDNNPYTNPNNHNGQALYEACINRHINIVKLLLACDNIEPSINHNYALRAIIHNDNNDNNNDIALLLLNDNRTNINDFNVVNIRAMMNKPHIFHQALIKPNINFQFINTAIYTMCLDMIYNKKKVHNNLHILDQLLTHPQFIPSLLFIEEDTHIIGYILDDNLVVFEKILLCDNLVLSQNIIRYIYVNWSHSNNYINLLRFVIEYSSYKDIVIETLYNIIHTHPNKKSNMIFENIHRYYQIENTYFDIMYNNKMYNMCKKYMLSSKVNIKQLFIDFRQGKYNMMSQVFLNYY
jgi:hypothetical protein